MKKRVLVIVSLLALMLTIPAYAAQKRAPDVLPGLSFNGTTATCSVLASGDYITDDISLEIELWQGNNLIESWSKSGEAYIEFADTVSVIKGKTYTLKVYAEINNVEIPVVTITKTCK